MAAEHRRNPLDLEHALMSNPQIPDLATRTKSIENLRQTRREIVESNQELAEIEAQIDSPSRGSANESYTPKN